MAGPQQIPNAEVVQAMRSLPASRLPMEVRTELAMILDPPKTCPNRDYRFFAELLGLLSTQWEFLDAQKCRDETSSTRLIIQYLIHKRGDTFKISHIYEALQKMQLNGPMIIQNYVRCNWRSLGLDTRPGQQNQEAPGCACRQCIQGIGSPSTCRNMNSPPPSYEEAVGPNMSLADRHGESAVVHGQDQFCENRPVEHECLDESTRLKVILEERRPTGYTGCVQSGSAVCKTRGCMQNGVRHRQTSGNILPLHGPKSLINEEHFTQHQPRWELSSNTSMDQAELRAPHQEGHFNQLSIPPSNDSAIRDENPHNNIGWNILPQSADPECFLNSIIENQGSSGAMSQGSSGAMSQGSSGAMPQGSSGAMSQGSSGAMSQGSSGAMSQGSSGAMSSRAGSRPASFPGDSLPSDAKSHLPVRPVSDGFPCSHQGACNCSLYHAVGTGSQRCLPWPTIPSNCFNQDPERQVMERKSQQTYVQYSSVCEGELASPTCLSQHPMQHTGHSPQSARQIRNGLSEETSVKQSMDVGPHSTNSMVSQPDPAVRKHHITKQFVINSTFPDGKDPAQQQPVENGQRKSRGKTGKKQPKTGDPGHSPRKPNVIIRQTVQNHQEHFVLLLAGDIKLGKELSDQVRDLEQSLRKYQIPYVIVTSTSEQPIIWLTEAQCKTLPALQSNKSSVSAFVTACYKKAKKILIAVSPGYVLYADEYVNGAQRTASTMQEIIRCLHERMKVERARCSTHRLWPLLLHQLTTDRTHIPNFLTSVLFYWFGRRNVENFAVVLQRELQVNAHQN